MHPQQLHSKPLDAKGAFARAAIQIEVKGANGVKKSINCIDSYMKIRVHTYQAQLVVKLGVVCCHLGLKTNASHDAHRL